MINEPPQVQSAEQAAFLLRDALATAYEYIEHYCACGNARPFVAKTARRALQATEAYAAPVDKNTSPSG